jgi:hypothetical protein
MTTTTQLACGSLLSREEQAGGWYAYINGGDYAAEEQELLVDALMEAQKDEFDTLLPEHCYWFPATSQIIGPVDVEHDFDDLDEVMTQAAESVIERYEEIEREALGR